MTEIVRRTRGLSDIGVVHKTQSTEVATAIRLRKNVLLLTLTTDQVRWKAAKVEFQRYGDYFGSSLKNL
ncbi:hypothetical protein J6590_094995, partial [Homalodisca vitripennis]